MALNELVGTVTTNSACLYEIRCPKRGLIYNRRRWDEISKVWKEKEVLYAMPMSGSNAQITSWIICVNG